jgi:vancomycin resistance protein YoaR
VSFEHSSSFGSSTTRPESESYHLTSLPEAADWPAEPERRRTRPHSRPRRRRSRQLWMGLIGLLLLVVIAISAGLYSLDQSYAGRIYPNVSIHGVAVGELSAAEASQRLHERFAPFLAQPVTLSFADRTWTPTADELGVRLEIERATRDALAAGRGNSFFVNLREVMAVYQHGLELPLHLTVDQATMQAYLLARVAEIERPAVDARLALNGASIAIAPAVMGQQVLIGETLQEITATVQDLTPETVVLRTRQVQPSLSDAVVSEAQAELNAILATPLTLSVEGGRGVYLWEREQLAELVRLERVTADGRDRLVVSLDGDEVQARIAAIADATEVRGRAPRLNWNNGRPQIFQAGTDGLRINEALASELVLSALNNPAEQRELALPMVSVPSPVTDSTLAQLGLRDLLSVGRSDFAGSASYRITNIQAGMRLLHGVLIAPGEEFSFNKTIGQIDGTNGFVEGYAIIRNRTQLEWGGGICQDSTTMFRAAFWAGLPITERWGHSFYISWYDKYGFGEYGNGPGMDAAIFTGALDFKFLNDTGNWILIQTAVDKSRALAEVRLYGTSDGRQVSLLGPTTTSRQPAPTAPVYVADSSRPRGSIRQSDTARGGMTIEFTRVIERADQIIERRTFETRFKPWPNIFEVNPADLGPDGRPIPVATPTPDPEQEVPPTDAPPADAPPADAPAPPAPEPAPPAPEPAPPAPEPAP